MSDASMRGSLDWDRFLDIEIPLPPIEKQQEYVDIYSNLLRLSSSHEKSFADLQFITNAYTEKLVEKYGTNLLGNYITATDKRNYDLGSKDIKGISIQKKFIVSKANMDGVSLASYRVVHPGQFGYVTVTSRNGDKVSVALNTDDIPYVVSSSYQTFKVTDESKLMPEFILLWFKRPEFERYARFNSWGSARETFDWSEMQRVQLPIPPVSVQQSIVAIYHALEARKRLTDMLKTLTKEICPVLIKDARNNILEVAA